MAMIKCPHCNTFNPDSLKACYKCKEILGNICAERPSLNQIPNSIPQRKKQSLDKLLKNPSSVHVSKLWLIPLILLGLYFLVTFQTAQRSLEFNKKMQPYDEASKRRHAARRVLLQGMRRSDIWNEEEFFKNAGDLEAGQKAGIYSKDIKAAQREKDLLHYLIDHDLDYKEYSRYFKD